MKAVFEKKAIVFAGIILISALISGCGEFLDMSVSAGGTEKDETDAAKGFGQYEITDRDRDTMESGALEINLDEPEDDRTDIYSYESGEITIRSGGKYLIKGKLDNGSLIIHVFEDEMVHLILDNAEINAVNGAAIYVEQAAKVILTAKEGTINILSDGMKYKETQKACLFSNSDLTINGSGSLAVYAYYADGVRSKDQVKAVNANLYVKAKGDGIRGNDGVILSGSATEVECEGTGIRSVSERDMVVMQGGSCKVIAGKNAVDANRYVSVRDCQTDLYSVWESIKCDGIRDIEETVE